MAAPVVVDEKAGWCSNCRRGSHLMCTSPVCKCPQGGHDRRPEAGSKKGPQPMSSNNGTTAAVAERPASQAPAPARAVRTATRRPAGSPTPKPVKLKPVFGLAEVDELPPKKEHQPAWVERVANMLGVLAAGGSPKWHRLVLYPTTRGAAMTVGRFRKQFPDEEWEWEAREEEYGDQSGIYVRRVPVEAPGE